MVQIGNGAGGNAGLMELEAAEAALDAIWERLPLATRNAVFVTRKAEVFGDIAQRPSNAFAAGEPLLTYLEPVCFARTLLPDGTFGFGVSTDFEILTPDGKILGGQKAFQTIDMASRGRVRELFLNLTLTLDGLPAGAYLLGNTVHDNGGGQSTRVEQAFTIEAETATLRPAS